MGACWFCTWGWPQAVRDIYDAAYAKIGESAMHYGPAHIVWEDENFGDSSIQFCIDALDKREYCGEDDDRMSDDTLAILRDSLVALKDVPEEYRREPDGFDLETSNPKDFPPPAGVPWARRTR